MRRSPFIGLRGAVLLDEIQRAPDFLLAIKDEVDRTTAPGRFLPTGSTNYLTTPAVERRADRARHAGYGMRRIRAEHELHPYAADWWPIGQGVGYGTSFVNQAADHLERWPDGPWEPGLTVGARVQAVCEAIERAAAEHGWVAVSDILSG
jgi:hypothetical protein